jgi:tRNA pseudouridine38-40 synthase
MERYERLKLTVAYDGRPFRGWQSQPNGNGIQDHLKNAFFTILAQPVKLHGAGRTDAGVHAFAQVAHVDVLYHKYALPTWTAALNAHLPREIRVLKCEHARDGFHAQYSAVGKVYIYRIWNHPIHHPLEIARSWHVVQPLDLDALRSARNRLIGTHDFASFAANRGRVEETTRTIYDIRIKRRRELLTVEFAANGFLYRMARMLIGSMTKVASGRKPLSWFDQLLHEPGKQKADLTAPPEGLYLLKVLYSKIQEPGTGDTR